MMTVEKSIKNSVTNLIKNKIPNPYLDAEILLSFVLNKPREFLLAHPEKKLSNRQKIAFEKLIKKRLHGWPVAYLIGYKYFHGLKFKVDNNVLVPRPETELIVDDILKKHGHGAILDIGTGSGAIIISLAKNFSSNQRIKFIASDISQKALLIAKKNAKLNHLNSKIIFIKSDLISDKIIQKIQKLNSLTITANLPYLTKEQIAKSNSIKKEPYLALYGGKNGLRLYKKLFSQLLEYKSMLPGVILAYLEIDPSQKQQIKKIIKLLHPTATVNFKYDLRGCTRVAVVSITL